MSNPRFIVGAYASLPGDQDERALYYALLGEQAWIDGAELPFPGDLADAAQRHTLAQIIPKHWRFNTVTLIPGTMQHVWADGAFGLASPDPAGRKAALDLVREAHDAIADFTDARGSDDVTYLEIHSAPTAHAEADAMRRSVEELLAWDWGTTRLVIEHCDAYIEGQIPEKGFLTIDEEIAVCKETGIGMTVNWGRSCLEGRTPTVPESHVRKATTNGVLTGLMFSGASDQATQFGSAWADGHLPMRPDEPTSLMDADGVATCARIARECPQLAYLGAKVCVPASDTPAARMNRLAHIHTAIDAQGANAADGGDAPTRNGMRVLAFDLGGTKIASGLVTFNADGTLTGRVSHTASIPTNPAEGGPAVLRRLVDFAAERLTDLEGIDAIAVGSAGVVDSARGIITSSTDLIPGWTGQRIADALHDALDLPVGIVNDVVAHGLGEAHHGAGAGQPRVLSVGVGTGIGGALITNGRPVLGAHDVAGHIGHVMHPLGRGVPCSCGTTCGHIEPVASGTGLATLYAMRSADACARRPANGREVCARAATGDPLAISVLADAGRALGETLGGIANLLDPDVIVVSGSVTKAGFTWWNGLRAGFADSALTLTRATPLIEGTLGGDAPLIGAAVAIHQKLHGHH